MANLINNGILPMTFTNKADYEKLGLLDELVIKDAREQVKKACEGENIKITNKTQGYDFEVALSISDRQRDMLLAGGLLNLTKELSEK